MRGPPDPLREPTAPAAHASPAPRPNVGRILLVAMAAAVFLAAAGAFGTGSKPFVLRLGYWVLALGIGAGVGATLATGLSRMGWLDGPTWRNVGLLSLAISAPLVAITWVLTSLVFEQPMDVGTLAGVALPVLIVTAAMTTLSVLAHRSSRFAPAPSASLAPPPIQVLAAAPAPRPRLLDRLPPRLRGAELIALQAEDHYLRLHTTLGSDLILMRLADAVAEAEGIEGAQTHRSWWVARSAVVDAVRSDGRATLKLTGGLEAPVSRTFAPALREARWF